MSLLERVLTLLCPNLKSVVEKSNEPEKMLRQLLLDMRNQLVQVKTQLAIAIAESHKHQKRSKERMLEAETWSKKAEQAIQQGNDHAARTALGHYNEAVKQAEYYKQQQQQQQQLIATMRSILRQLEAKISEIETTIDTLTTQKRNVLIQERVLGALSSAEKQRERENREHGNNYRQ
ncbi:MAG: PspA/IM30 family protein [Ktedonobacteraceae bacterium]|nr:PspA/IM30 family protein [Ktedonobacteraceae bacterium]